MVHWTKTNKAETTKKKISSTLKKSGIKPPSRLGIKHTKSAIKKAISTKRKNGTLKHTKERTQKIQLARKKYYDKIGRKTPISDRIKRTKKYKVWRKAVFSRDEYRCVLCGHMGYIEADHITRKSDLLSECNYDYDVCMKYKPLWDISNGRTLCRPCHMKTDNYGNRKMIE